MAEVTRAPARTIDWSGVKTEPGIFHDLDIVVISADYRQMYKETWRCDVETEVYWQGECLGAATFDCSDPDRLARLLGFDGTGLVGGKLVLDLTVEEFYDFGTSDFWLDAAESDTLWLLNEIFTGLGLHEDFSHAFRAFLLTALS